MSGGPPKVAVIVPTHDHAATLDLAVRSALAQTYRDLEVIVVGDGVGDDTRGVVSALSGQDDRIRFLDLPKGPHHGEVYRGQAIDGSDAEIVCYLCDDDLLLPDHVETMVDLLATADLAHSLNGYLDVDGHWYYYWGDLSLAESRAWMLDPNRNFVSLTGTAHTVAAYRRLPQGWRLTPPGRWVDHYMWEQFLTQPWVVAVTSPRVTALQLPTHLGGRHSWEPAVRRQELERWADAVASPEGRADLEASLRRAMLGQATEQFLAADALKVSQPLTEVHIQNLTERAEAAEHGVAFLQDSVRSADEAIAFLRASLHEAVAAAQDSEGLRIVAEESAVALSENLATMEGTRTWRLRSALLGAPGLSVVLRLLARRTT